MVIAILSMVKLKPTHLCKTWGNNQLQYRISFLFAYSGDIKNDNHDFAKLAQFPQ